MVVFTAPWSYRFSPGIRSRYSFGLENGARGFVRCNRISACGIQEPAVVVYRDGETRAFHDLADAPPDAFAAMAAQTASFFRGERPEPVMGGVQGRAVLAALLAALESARLGAPVDVAE